MIVNVEIKCLPWEPDADPDRFVVRAVAEIVRAAARLDAPGRLHRVVVRPGRDRRLAAFAPEIATGG